jgi:L-lactate dehydrogenase complex protein LldF
VFRNVGGHAYCSVYPGPIGCLLTPLLQGLAEHAELPRASSLCGACKVACPVKIDIPAFLIKLRAASRDLQPLSKRVGVNSWKWVVGSPRLFGWAQRSLGWMLGRDHDGWINRGPGPADDWLKVRDLPPLPKKSFRQLWQEGLRDET